MADSSIGLHQTWLIESILRGRSDLIHRYVSVGMQHLKHRDYVPAKETYINMVTKLHKKNLDIDARAKVFDPSCRAKALVHTVYLVLISFRDSGTTPKVGARHIADKHGLVVVLS